MAARLNKESNEEQALVCLFATFYDTLTRVVPATILNENVVRQSKVLEFAAACPNPYIMHIAVLLPGLLPLSPSYLTTNVTGIHTITQPLLPKRDDPEYSWLFRCPYHDWSWMPDYIVQQLLQEWSVEPGALSADRVV